MGYFDTRARWLDRAVFATATGSVFHSSADCEALRVGWAKAIESGGHKSKLRRLSLREAKRSRLSPCFRCGEPD